MDLYAAINDLRSRKEQVEKLIQVVEGIARERNASPGSVRGRGRKSMSAEERLVVSERMRKYWAGKRVARGMGAGSAAV
jgi:hypothetical protein